MKDNRLSAETSPYLLQHSENPVHWRAWNPDSLQEAREQNKPILLSSGYAACHWCHVMEKECFQSEKIAHFMNAHFVNIKLDREERPDIDAIYQAALAMTGQQGGWPLTAFLTPETVFFWGGTYFPNTPKLGRPDFYSVLQNIAQAWREKPNLVAQQAQSLKQEMQKRMTRAVVSNAVSDFQDLDSYIEAFLEWARAHCDKKFGGFKGRPKFPLPVLLRAIIGFASHSKEQELLSWLHTTLWHICQRGVYDVLDGGFARYSTDEYWVLPHFEKMLYDNGLMVEVLTQAWCLEQNALYAERVEKTIEWLERDMLTKNGGYASALDADSAGQEGKFYLWEESELRNTLNPDQYDCLVEKYACPITDHDFGHRTENVFVLARTPPITGEEEKHPLIASGLARLRERRSLRPRPMRDDKILADWNSLTLAGLVEAGIVFARKDWVRLAIRRWHALWKLLAAEDQEQIFHSFCKGKRHIAGFLEDYAGFAQAALCLFEASGNHYWLKSALRLMEKIEDSFGDGTGGYFQSDTETSSESFIRLHSFHDNVTPSGNGLMAQNAARLFLLTGDERWKNRVESLFKKFMSGDYRNGVLSPEILRASFMVSSGVTGIVCGSGFEADALQRQFFIRQRVNGVLIRLSSRQGEFFEAPHPAAGKKPIGGRATLYICRLGVCSAPIHFKDGLSQDSIF